MEELLLRFHDYRNRKVGKSLDWPADFSPAAASCFEFEFESIESRASLSLNIPEEEAELFFALPIIPMS